jgi:hypothetical protein
MAARLWTALLILAAVFAMHGLQCAADGAHASGAAHTTSVVAPAAAAGVDSHVAGIPTTAMTAAQIGAGPTVDGGHGSAPHGSAGHLWTLCLAVLAAAIAVLLALLVPRLVGLVSPALRQARARAAGWLTPLRPPDLSALCLLRI